MKAIVVVFAPEPDIRPSGVQVEPRLEIDGADWHSDLDQSKGDSQPKPMMGRESVIPFWTWFIENPRPTSCH